MFSNIWLLIIFCVVIVTMLVIDLGVVHKKNSPISNRVALRWTLTWIGLSMGFSALVWWNLGFTKFTEYQSAYWIEEALSVDNMFVFILVFKFFKLDASLQHRVLFWGILGALIFRAIFIFSGAGLIQLTYLPSFDLFGYHFSLNQGMKLQDGFFYRPNLILTIFGAILLFTGIKSLFNSNHNDEKDFNSSFGARLVRKVFPITNNYHGDRFFVKKGAKKFATKLFLVLIVIETTDLIFAIDSIPAVMAIAPNDPMILYTSNIFAVLGLRSLYFLLANSIHRFYMLQYGLAFILGFIGIKMILAPFFHLDAFLSMLIVLGALATSILFSLLGKANFKDSI